MNSVPDRIIPFHPLSALFFNGATSQFDFLSVVYAPNTFFFEADARIGAPPGVVTITTTLPICLPLRYTRKPGRYGLTVLKSLFHSLELTRQDLADRTSLNLFVTLENSILGTGHLEIGGFDLTTSPNRRMA